MSSHRINPQLAEVLDFLQENPERFLELSEAFCSPTIKAAMRRYMGLRGYSVPERGNEKSSGNRPPFQRQNNRYNKVDR